MKNLKTYIVAAVTTLALLHDSVSAVQPQYPQVALPSGFVSEPIITGLSYPTAISFAGGNRIFVAQKEGKVQVWQNGVLQTTPFVDITSEVNTAGDRGLLGMAVHPDFPDMPYVYLLYTYDPPTAPRYGSGSRVSRLMRVTADTANPNVASTAADARVILVGKNSTLQNIHDVLSDTGLPACQSPDTGAYVQDCIPADTKSHNGGAVMFGPDGMLYFSHGEGSHWTYTDPRSFRAQDLDSMAGKVFRVDPITGQGLASNPYYDGNPDSNRSKAYTIGFRNPFRFALHPVTGEIYVSDVGWELWEELNVGAGKNFGWPCFEGGNGSNLPQAVFQNDPATQTRCTHINQLGNTQPAAYAYYHKVAPGGGALIAGAFYSGTVYPPEYRGALFLVDYTRMWMKYATLDTQGKLTVNDFGSAVSDNNSGPVQILSGPDTNVYYVVLGSAPDKGEVRRLRYTAAGNAPPTARLDVADVEGALPMVVKFSALDSTDPDGQALSYIWDFGDGGNSIEASTTYTYTRKGNYTVRLVVSDPLGATSQAEVKISAGNFTPYVSITQPISGTFFEVNQTITFTAVATDTEDGDISTQVNWEGVLHHNQHTHPNFLTAIGVSGTFIYADHGDNIWLELCANVTDSEGAVSTRPCVRLLPATSVYTFTTVPSGLALQFDGQSFETPFAITSVVGSRREVIAPTTQFTYTFAGWSNGGTRAQLVDITSANPTLVAHYNSDKRIYMPMAMSGT